MEPPLGIPEADAERMRSAIHRMMEAVSLILQDVLE